MNTGGFGAPGFSFGTTNSTAVVNPMGASSIFTSQANTMGLGGTTTQSIFGPSTATVPSMFGGGTVGAPSLFGGTNTTISTGTTPSTGLFTGLGTQPMKPLTFSTPTSSVFGIQNPTATSYPSFNAHTFAAPSMPGAAISTTTSTSTTTAAPVGLGGVDFSQISGGNSASGGKNDSKTIKEQLLPNEISQTINNFRRFVKDQKVIREEISRVSSKPIHKVQEETASLKQLLGSLTSSLQRNALAIDKLKMASAQDLKNAEIAQRTKDLPPSMQFENTAPTQYFQELVIGFEHQMLQCRQQIQQLEEHFASLAQPFMLSTQELNAIVRRLHETFVALAAQLQTVHDAVRVQKESFLSIRRALVGDTSNVFERRQQAITPHQNNPRRVEVPVTLGPAPFSGYPNNALFMSNRSQPGGGPTMGGPQALTFGHTPQPTNMVSNQMGYYSGNFGSPAADNKPFQLQKPPSGNKRGKRWTTS